MPPADSDDWTMSLLTTEEENVLLPILRMLSDSSDSSQGSEDYSDDTEYDHIVSVDQQLDSSTEDFHSDTSVNEGYSLTAAELDDIGQVLATPERDQFTNRAITDQVIDRQDVTIDNFDGQDQINNGRTDVPKFCYFCETRGKPEQVYTSHDLGDESGRVTCPALREIRCSLCGAAGVFVHTEPRCQNNWGKLCNVQFWYS